MLNRFLFCSLVLVFLSPDLLLANRKLAEQYVQSYKSIAITEMHRTGIPASIKLAQGLLESSWGQSDLAILANNHFGIKCGGEWQGERYFKVDDDKDHEGNMIESCFRKFMNAEDSYIAHSYFLTNPAKKSRYGFLFDFPTTDYVSWSEGLQFSGYATDKKYADKLIKLIEDYQLYQYDVLLPKSNPELTKNKEKVNEPSKVIEEVVQTPAMKPQINQQDSKVTIQKKRINGLQCALAKEGETIESIAKNTKVNKHDIVIFNESRYYLDTPLKEGQLIYLEPKKRFNENHDMHVVKEDETLFDIAQKYGIKLSSLASRNKIPEHARITKGLKLFINQPGMDHSHLREELVTEEFIDFGNIK